MRARFHRRTPDTLNRLRQRSRGRKITDLITRTHSIGWIWSWSDHLGSRHFYCGYELSKAWAAFKFLKVHQRPVLPTNRRPFIPRYLFNDNGCSFSGIKYRKTCCTSQKGTTMSSLYFPARDNRITSRSCPSGSFRFLSFTFLVFRYEVWTWQKLAQVCSTWRQIMFASPRRLDLRLTCTGGKPVRDMLDAFPNFPINITYWRMTPSLHVPRKYLDNILAALERRDQACGISLTGLTTPLFETFVTMMQEPFPTLTFLEFRSVGTGIDDVETAPIIPDTFLGRSAPRLQSLTLSSIAFQGLPKLLFSAKDLVSLELTGIPVTGYMYISSEALADSLSALPRLKWCHIINTSP
ncbi:hypothetical protein BJV74DRAFT_102218 [Russula compacta]|nr:hypothetical protein BJV74DRAFT_102218 [Russula compacta]